MKAILHTHSTPAHAKCDTVAAQKRHADLLLDAIRQQVHTELEARGGKGKPCPTDISRATLHGTQDLVVGIAMKNSLIIRKEALEIITQTTVETVEYSLHASA